MKRIISKSLISNSYVIELNCVNESDMVSLTSPEEYIGNWKDYYDSIDYNSMDDVWFDFNDIDQSLFIIDDGGEMIRLKDSTLVNIVFRGDSCRLWKEHDKEKIEYIDYLLKTYG